VSKLGRLGQLLDRGLITADEFAVLKAEAMREISQ
jgi:hypothetical protein